MVERAQINERLPPDCQGFVTSVACGCTNSVPLHVEEDVNGVGSEQHVDQHTAQVD